MCLGTSATTKRQKASSFFQTTSQFRSSSWGLTPRAAEDEIALARPAWRASRKHSLSHAYPQRTSPRRGDVIVASLREDVCRLLEVEMPPQNLPEESRWGRQVQGASRWPLSKANHKLDEQGETHTLTALRLPRHTSRPPGGHSRTPRTVCECSSPPLLSRSPPAPLVRSSTRFPPPQLPASDLVAHQQQATSQA